MVYLFVGFVGHFVCDLCLVVRKLNTSSKLVRFIILRNHFRDFYCSFLRKKNTSQCRIYCSYFSRVVCDMHPLPQCQRNCSTFFNHGLFVVQCGRMYVSGVVWLSVGNWVWEEDGLTTTVCFRFFSLLIAPK